MNISSAVDRRLWLALFALLCGGSVALALLLTLAHSVGMLDWSSAAGPDITGWRALFTEREFWRSLVYSVALTVITLCLAVALALALFALLGERVRHGWLARLLLLPLAVPPVVAALMAFTLLADSGLVSRLSHAFGWTATPADFPSLIFDPDGRGVVITHLVMVTPLLLLLFDNLATHLRLAALMQHGAALGANPTQAWRRIALPLLLRHARPVLTVYGLALLGAYELPLLIGAAQPAMVAVTIQRAVAGYDLAQRPLGYAMASTYFLLMLAVWALLQMRAARRDGRTP